ncbi:MAG: hypothetical protein D6796_17145, partial [Caldilineae bacterium]
PPTRPGLILVGCPPEEEHAFGPLLLTLLLRRRGWRVVYLGAAVPVHRMATTLQSIEPDLVVMSAQRLHTAATLLDMASALQKQHIPLAFGGRIFNQLPELTTRFHGYFLGRTLTESLHTIERLVNETPPALLDISPVTEAHRQAAAHFQRRRPLIEADIVRLLPDSPLADMPPAHLATANRELGNDLFAALKLGDVHFVQSDVSWVEGMIQNYNLPAAELHLYLTLYRRAAQTHLGETCQPVLDWLAQQASQ